MPRTTKEYVAWAGMLIGVAVACEWWNLSERSEELMKWIGIWSKLLSLS